MAGETVKTEAVCLSISPWSQTSHIVSWLTPMGKIATVVRGAERPKSFFLGQYDLNYTCEIVYYQRARGEIHALREASPVNLRENMRSRFRALSLAGYCRSIVGEMSPPGDDCSRWYDLLVKTLDRLDEPQFEDETLLAEMDVFDLQVLKLAGISPDFSNYDRKAEWSAFGVETGSFASVANGRQIRIMREVAEFLDNPQVKIKNLKIPLDAARVISVFYHFHLDCAFDRRRIVLSMIS